jgi:hypothetical protein
MSSKSEKPQSNNRVRVHLPSKLEPTYANFALITHSRSEIVIDFAQLMPQVPQARIQNRIVMTAFNAKLLLRALNEHISRFEDQYGEIVLPKGTSLADQLFRQGSPDSSQDDQPDE